MYKEHKLKRAQIKGIMQKNLCPEKLVSAAAVEKMRKKPFQLEYQEKYGGNYHGQK